MYRIIGADGREYGPVSAEQLRQWLVERRVNSQTRAQLEPGTEWKLLADFPELAVAPRTPAIVPRTNGMAVTGLVMRILSVIQCCSFIFGILGTIFSSVAISQVNKRPQEFTGKGMAVAGLVMPIAGLAVNLVLITIYWAAIVAAVASQR